MNLIDGFWHFGNLLALAFGVGLLSTVLAKLVWRQSLRNVGWGRMLRGAVLAGWAGMAVGLVLCGRDGRALVHGLTLVGVIAGLGWTAFLRPAR